MCADENDVELVPIQVGKPTQDAYIERYNWTLRQEVLNVYAFSDLEEVRDVLVLTTYLVHTKCNWTVVISSVTQHEPEVEA